jgi:large subunit ribosomal protein L4
MANFKVVTMTGADAGEIELADSVFAIEPNQSVMHAAVRAYLLNQRQGTQSTLTRTEVSGGGKKPWRQKGTGRARQGSTRSPQWTHGGVALGPKPRSYRTDLNKKVRKLALCSAMSEKAKSENLVIVDAIATEEYKTKVMVNMLNAIGAGKKALVVLDKVDEKVIKSFANIPGVKTAQYNTINVYDVLNADTFVMSKEAAVKVSEVYA